MKKVFIVFVMILVIGFCFVCGYYLERNINLEQKSEAKENSEMDNKILVEQTQLGIKRIKYCGCNRSK